MKAYKTTDINSTIISRKILSTVKSFETLLKDNGYDNTEYFSSK